MRPCMRILLLLAFAAAAPVLCYSEQPAPDETETNERLLERWKSDPEHYTRLQADLRAFWQLPADKQERLRQLDQQLHETDSTTQRRLWGVLEHYSAWYDRLPEADQRRINQAADNTQRVNLVRQLREEQWLKRQPQKDRDDLAKLPEEKRHSKIAELREEDRRRVAQWLRVLQSRDGNPAGRPAKPVRASDFPPDGQLFITQLLTPQLSREEQEHLKAVEGKWPYYARAILDLADKHPVKLPGAANCPTTFDKLPAEYRKELDNKNLLKSQREALKTATGKWPDFAVAATEIAHSKKPDLAPLGPAKPGDFTSLAPLKTFLDTTLPTKVSGTEKEELKKTEGKWPEYPTKVLELAAKYKLEVPLMRFPNLDEWREKLSSALPEVPDHMLRDFVLTELTPEQRNTLHLSINDPMSQERALQLYFKMKPWEKERMEKRDLQLLHGGGKGPPKRPGL